MIVSVQRVMPGVLAVVALAGCDVVFGFTEPGTDAPLDGGGDASDGGDAALPARCTEAGGLVELPLIADTYLRQGVTDDARGSEPVAYVGPGAVTLVRFEPGDGDFDALTVSLDQADLSTACAANSGCGPCAAGGSGTITVSFVRPDWDELTATYGLRAAGQPWAVAGAGGADRSSAVATVPFDGSDLTITDLPIGAATSSTWPAGLSLLLSVEGDIATAAMFHTREAPSTCGAPMRPRAFARCAGAASPICGNDVSETGEGCDDGNLIDGDGRSAVCQVEARCGNGMMDVGEQCDDGNTTSNDGCVNCMLEPVPV